MASTATGSACFCGKQVREPCTNAQLPWLDCQCIVFILHGPPWHPETDQLRASARCYCNTYRYRQTHTDYTCHAYRRRYGPCCCICCRRNWRLSAFTTTTKPHHMHPLCRLNRHPTPHRAYHPSQQNWAGYQIYQMSLIRLQQRKHPACPFWL